MPFQLLNAHEDQPLQQFLVSCAQALSQQMSVIDARYQDRDGTRVITAARQWVLIGLESLAHMTPNAWHKPRRAYRPTPDMLAMAQRIDACSSLDNLLQMEADLKQAAIRVLHG